MRRAETVVAAAQGLVRPATNRAHAASTRAFVWCLLLLAGVPVYAATPAWVTQDGAGGYQVHLWFFWSQAARTAGMPGFSWNGWMRIMPGWCCTRMR